jgi:hypothetical protein
MTLDVKPASFEVKTETYVGPEHLTANLFVQLREGRHDPHRLANGGRRVTAAPWEEAALANRSVRPSSVI